MGECLTEKEFELMEITGTQLPVFKRYKIEDWSVMLEEAYWSLWTRIERQNLFVKHVSVENFVLMSD